jgi:hypothetical protein
MSTKMRNILLAVAVAVGASAVLYLLGTTLGLPSEIAKGLAGLPAFTIKDLYEFLETRSAKLALAKVGSTSIANLEEFSINPLAAFLIATIMFAGMILLIGAVAGVLVAVGAAVAGGSELLDPNTKLFLWLVIYTSFPLKVIASAYIGRWIGTRSPLYGVTIAVSSALFGVSLSYAFSVLMISDDLFKALTGGEKTGTAALAQFITVFPDMLIYMIVGGLGVWSGRRRHLARYLTFILNVLPSETRLSIVEMARDEAGRASASVIPGGSVAIAA